MPRVNQPIHGFNAGCVSVEALTRIDLERLPFASEEMTNFFPRVIGSMTIRPGTRYLGETGTASVTSQLIPFVKNARDTALIEITSNSIMRVRYNDVLTSVDSQLVTRASVSTDIGDGDFGALTAWTDDDDAGATSDVSGGFLRLIGTGTGFARRTQQVTVGVGDVGVEHAIRVVVTRGPVLFRVGSTDQGQEYITEQKLRTGVHSLAFTPSGDFWVSVSAGDPVYRFVESIEIEAAGVMELPTIWTTSAIAYIRHDQIGDVIFCACDGFRQQRIERRSQRSWSVCDYTVDDGPFLGLNLTRLSLTPSGTSGNITLTASTPLFTSGHIGALFKLTHSGQTATATLGAEDTFTTDDLRVTGTVASGTRSFLVTITGTWTGTITLQRSFGEPGSWGDEATWTGNTVEGRTSNFDNEIVYYRIGFKTGDYGSGSAVVTLTYNNSLQTGIVRIVTVSDSVTATAEVLDTLGKASATFDWREGAWSNHRGFPNSVALHDGRLAWGDGDSVYLSVSDAFESFDQEVEGDAGPIIRSVGAGATDSIIWLKSLGRLFAGGATQEVQIRSSSFDEPLTPTAFTVKRVSSRGSSIVDAGDVDGTIVYASRDSRQFYEIAFSTETQDYTSRLLTRLNPEICSAGIARIAVQRQPDTRIWVVLFDGTVSVLTYERAESVVGWSKFETDGDVRDICVLPGSGEDQVYFVIERTIGGVVKRYLEKQALESDCIGGGVVRLMDSSIAYSGSSTTTISGLSHLNGKQVVVWASSGLIVSQSSMLTVSGGSITLPSAVTLCNVGLPYTARSKSMKLAFAAGLGSPLGQLKRVDHLGVILRYTSWAGIRFGRAYDKLNNFRRMVDGQDIGVTKYWDYLDTEMTGFDGKFGTDERIHCEVKAPYPATILGYTIGMVTNDKG